MELKISRMLSFKALALSLIVLSVAFTVNSSIFAVAEETAYIKRVAVVDETSIDRAYYIVPILVHHVEDKLYISPLIILSKESHSHALETFLKKDLSPEFKESELIVIGNIENSELSPVKSCIVPKETVWLTGSSPFTESISLMKRYWRKTSHVILSYKPSKYFRKLNIDESLNVTVMEVEEHYLSGNLMENTQRLLTLNVNEYTLALCNLTWSSPLSASDVNIVFYDPNGELAYSKHLPYKRVFSGSRDAVYAIGKAGRWRIGAYCSYMKYMVHCNFKLKVKLVKGYIVNIDIPKNCFLMKVQAENVHGKFMISAFYGSYPLLDEPKLLLDYTEYPIYFPPNGRVSIVLFPLDVSGNDRVKLHVSLYLMNENEFLDTILFLNSITLSSILNSPLIILSDNVTIDDLKKSVLTFPVEDKFIIVDARNRPLTTAILKNVRNAKCISSLWELFNYASMYTELNYMVLTIPCSNLLLLSTYVASARKGVVVIPPPYAFSIFSDLELLWKSLLYSSDSVRDVKILERSPPFTYMLYYASELSSFIESLLPLRFSEGAFVAVLSPLDGIPPLVDRCLIGKYFVGRIAGENAESLSIYCSRTLMRELLFSKFFSNDALLSMISFSYGLQIYQFFNNTIRKLPFDSSRAYPGSIRGAGLDLKMHTSSFKVLQTLRENPRLFIYLGPSVNGTSLMFFEPDSSMAFERIHGTGSVEEPDIDIDYIVKPMQLEEFDVSVIDEVHIDLSTTAIIISANCSAQWEIAKHFIEAGCPIYFGLMSCCKIGYTDKMYYIFLTQFLSGKSAGEAFNASVAIGLLHVYSLSKFSAIDKYEESRGVPSSLVILYGDPAFRIPFKKAKIELIQVSEFDELPSRTAFSNTVSVAIALVLTLTAYILVLEADRRFKAVI